MTVEERAKESFLKSKVHWTKEDAYVQGYKDCFNDQQKIDIDKALDWISKHLNRVDGWSVIESSFRKAMEE